MAASARARSATSGTRRCVSRGGMPCDLWPLLVLGAVAIPAGLLVFRAGERYAKRHGKLKRSG
jgi:hypothetical protein